MATKQWDVDIPQGWFMSWFVTTQAANRMTVKLADNKITYFEASKQSTNVEPPLDTGCYSVKGTGLTLIVTVEGSNKLDGEPQKYDIKAAKGGEVVGKEFALCLEDGTDNDYNDVAVNIIAWKPKG